MAVVDSHKPYLPVFAPASPFYSEEHEAFRSTVRRFVEREIMPHVDQWDEAEEFPRELYRKASAAGLLQLGFPEEYGGVADRPVLRHRQGRGDGAPRQRRGERQPQQPHDRRAAHRRARPGMDEAQGPAGGAGGREDQRACHHRAVGRLGRRQPQDHGAARGRSLPRQRLQDVHHLGHARRLLHRRRAHRRAGRRRRLAAADRARPRGLRAHQAQEDGLVGVRHRPALLRQRQGPGRQPDRRRRTRASSASC